MKFDTPQADIDWALSVQNSVKPEEMALYMECMNGRNMSERINNRDINEREPGRDIRDGCLLTGIFVTCRPKENYTPEHEAPKTKLNKTKKKK
jgi:hypothetical protein